MIERLPTPWGLVRSGVAPDHPKIKSVTRVYEKTAAHPRFRYFGNVCFGDTSRARSCSRTTTRSSMPPARRWTARSASPAKTCPARTPRPSSSAGTTATPTTPASRSTSCRPSAPSSSATATSQSTSRACSCSSADELAPTDTADHALEVLARSRVQEVVVVGRRGPAQAAFTNPELLELGELTDADVVVDADELERALAVHDEAAEQHATARRNVEILREYAQRTPTRGAQARRTALPALARSADRRRGRRRWPTSSWCTTSSSPTTTAPCARARQSRPRRSPPASSSARSATAASRCPASPSTSAPPSILNDAGRVLDPDSRAPLPGEYVVGWIKRGPSGVIGTNKKDAQETVDAMLVDLAPSKQRRARPAPQPRTARSGAAADRGAAARAPACSSSPTPAGRPSTATSASSARRSGRPRVKLTDIEQMLRIAASETPG